MRSLVDSKARIAKFKKALDAALQGVDPVAAIKAYLSVFEHGYGRPPQALDVRGSIVDPSKQQIYRASFGDGAPFDTPDSDPGVADAPPVPGEAGA